MSEGLEFCSSSEYAHEIYDDANNSTLTIMKKLVTEMAGLFEDEVFHMGADEIHQTGPCNIANLKAFE